MISSFFCIYNSFRNKSALLWKILMNIYGSTIIIYVWSLLSYVKNFLAPRLAFSCTLYGNFLFLSSFSHFLLRMYSVVCLEELIFCVLFCALIWSGFILMIMHVTSCLLLSGMQSFHFSFYLVFWI